MTLRFLRAAELGTLTGFVASVLGWQINLVAIQQGLERGRRAAFSVGFGAATGDFLFLAAALAGIAPLASHSWIQHGMKWIGASVILLIGIRFLLQPGGPASPKRARHHPAKSFLLGFLIVITNPLLFFVWVGVISFLVTHFQEASLLEERRVFLGTFLAGALVWFLFLSRALLHGVTKWGKERLELLSRIFSLLLIAAGIFLILENFWS